MYAKARRTIKGEGEYIIKSDTHWIMVYHGIFGSSIEYFNKIFNMKMLNDIVKTLILLVKILPFLEKKIVLILIKTIP